MPFDWLDSRPDSNRSGCSCRRVELRPPPDLKFGQNRFQNLPCLFTGDDRVAIALSLQVFPSLIQHRIGLIQSRIVDPAVTLLGLGQFAFDDSNHSDRLEAGWPASDGIPLDEK